MDEPRWSLDDIYPGQEEWEQDFARVKEGLGAVVRYRGRLGEGGAILLDALKARDELWETFARVSLWAGLKFDMDTTDALAQELHDRASSLGVEVSAAVSFMAPEILTLPDAVLASSMEDEPGLETYRFVLENLLDNRSHTLPPPEAAIVARTGEVLQAPGRIFGMIDNADLVFEPIRGEEGQELPVTRGHYVVLMQSRDRRIRRDAFTSLYGAYRRLSNTLSATLGAGVKRDIFLARVHKHPSSLAAALHRDRITADVYENLIAAVRSRVELLHRYMELRRRSLGVDELHMYDILVPLVPDVEWRVGYPEAVGMVREGLAPLGPDYARTLAEALEGGWIDVPERPGKAGGAYCRAVYGVHPYVLLNYHPNIKNTFTLAHEMGHAMHSVYAGREQPFIYARPASLTPEVASNVNEVLVIEHLLHTVGDSRRRLYLLDHYLERFRAILFRQTMFAEFEKTIHERAEAGQALTNGFLQETYHRLNVEYHGPAMNVDREIDLEWSRIPHFYSAFTVYRYATGLAAAIAISQGILASRQGALERYLEFLKRGSSDYSLNLLRLAGVDMSCPEPVEEALRRFGRLLEELERAL